jgi:hypothetical protein
VATDGAEAVMLRDQPILIALIAKPGELVPIIARNDPIPAAKAIQADVVQHRAAIEIYIL